MDRPCIEVHRRRNRGRDCVASGSWSGPVARPAKRRFAACPPSAMRRGRTVVSARQEPRDEDADVQIRRAVRTGALNSTARWARASSVRRCEWEGHPLQVRCRSHRRRWRPLLAGVEHSRQGRRTPGGKSSGRRGVRHCGSWPRQVLRPRRPRRPAVPSLRLRTLCAECAAGPSRRRHTRPVTRRHEGHHRGQVGVRGSIPSVAEAARVDDLSGPGPPWRLGQRRHDRRTVIRAVVPVLRTVQPIEHGSRGVDDPVP